MAVQPPPPNRRHGTTKPAAQNGTSNSSSNKPPGESHRVYWQQWLKSSATTANNNSHNNNATADFGRRELITSSAAIRISANTAKAQDVTRLLRKTLNLSAFSQSADGDSLVLVGTLYSIPRDYVQFEHESIPLANDVARSSSGILEPYHVIKTLDPLDSPLQVRDQMMEYLKRVQEDIDSQKKRRQDLGGAVQQPQQQQQSVASKAAVHPHSPTASSNRPVISPKLQWYYVPGHQSTPPTSPIPSCIDLDGYCTSLDEEEYSSGDDDDDDGNHNGGNDADDDDDHHDAITKKQELGDEEKKQDGGMDANDQDHLQSLHSDHDGYTSLLSRMSTELGYDASPSTNLPSSPSSSLLLNTPHYKRKHRRRRREMKRYIQLSQCQSAGQSHATDERHRREMLCDWQQQQHLQQQQQRQQMTYWDYATAPSSTNDTDGSTEQQQHHHFVEEQQQQSQAQQYQQYLPNPTHRPAPSTFSVWSSSNGGCCCLSGYLLHQSHRDPHVWRQVFCVLTEDHFWFVTRVINHYEDDDLASSAIPIVPVAKHHGMMPLQNVMLLEPEPPKKNGTSYTYNSNAPLHRIPHSFELENTTRQRRRHNNNNNNNKTTNNNHQSNVFRAPNRRTQQRWISALRDRIQQIQHDNAAMTHAELIVSEETLARNNRRLQLSVEPMLSSVVSTQQQDDTPRNNNKQQLQNDTLHWGIQVARFREQCRHTHAIMPETQSIVVGDGNATIATVATLIPSQQQQNNKKTTTKNALSTKNGLALEIELMTATIWNDASQLLTRATQIVSKLQKQHHTTKRYISLETTCRHIDYMIMGEFRQFSSKNGFVDTTANMYIPEHDTPPPMDLFDGLLKELQTQTMELL